MTPTLYPASNSPRRREILERMRLPYTVFAAEADERLGGGIPAEEACEILAARKALAARDGLAAAGRFGGDDLLLAADTLVFLDGRPLGKPKDEAEALDMLLSLRGRGHTVRTGVCLLRGKRSFSLSDAAVVRMRDFSMEEAAAYVRTGEPLDKAGAYGVQGIGAVLIERIEGDFFTVMGLPPRGVCRLLHAAGVSYFDWIGECV